MNTEKVKVNEEFKRDSVVYKAIPVESGVGESGCKGCFNECGDIDDCIEFPRCDTGGGLIFVSVDGCNGGNS